MVKKRRSRYYNEPTYSFSPRRSAGGLHRSRARAEALLHRRAFEVLGRGVPLLLRSWRVSACGRSCGAAFEYSVVGGIRLGKCSPHRMLSRL